jgi:hypothetical protein
MNDQSALSGALLPVIRQAVQVASGYLLGTGMLNENEITIIAGAIASFATLIWMLISRKRAVKAEAPKP